MAVIHKWEEKFGLVAPYRLITVITLPAKTLGESNPSGYNYAVQEAMEAARALGVSVGTCDICGTVLNNNFVCRDSAGKKFVIGCDCATKLDKCQFVTDIQKAERLRKADLRRAQKKAEMEAKIAAHRAEMDAQRARNGGFTDAELDEKAHKEARKAEAMENLGWLYDLLLDSGKGGPFISEIMTEIMEGHSRSLNAFSPRCLDILKSIATNKGKNKAALAIWESKVAH